MRFRLKTPTALLFCSLGGMAYFNAIASIDTFFLFKSYLFLLPIGSSLLVYLLWFKRDRISD